MNEVVITYAREQLPQGPSVFLAGPTPRRADVESWRPAAIAALTKWWVRPEALHVFSPESRDGKRADEYDHQVEWETLARAQADVILYWIPRDVVTLPGFTTNVEFGLDATSGRAVLGCPPDCPNPERNKYLIWVAHRYGVPVSETLTEVVTKTIHLAARAAEQRWR